MCLRITSKGLYKKYETGKTRKTLLKNNYLLNLLESEFGSRPLYILFVWTRSGAGEFTLSVFLVVFLNKLKILLRHVFVYIYKATWLKKCNDLIINALQTASRTLFKFNRLYIHILLLFDLEIRLEKILLLYRIRKMHSTFVFF